MIAAGTTDKIIRVWCHLSAAPIAVLSKHTETITALHFCPCSLYEIPQYLPAISGDETVSFWRYRYTKDGNNLNQSRLVITRKCVSEALR